jgi:hypothetical protein
VDNHNQEILAVLVVAGYMAAVEGYNLVAVVHTLPLDLSSEIEYLMS